MIVYFTSLFSKDIEDVQDSKVSERLANVIEDLEVAQQLTEISNVKKMKNSKGYYRIRIGDYRLGILIKDNAVYLMRFKHRKDIYSIFP